ncbi:MAG: DUF6033 family protein [Planctomycetaceae bacterium]|nr:DUF6033 family protein [Planctomycetaceae bacterium]
MDTIGSVTQSPRTASAAPASTQVTLRDLQRQYPRLKLSAQAFGSADAQRDYAMNQTGKYNIAIDPRAIDRMGEDSEFAATIHGILGGVEENEDWLEREISKNPNTTLIASGAVIDKDGNLNAWCVSKTSTSSEGMLSMSRKSREALAKKVEEKRKKEAEEAEEAERLEETTRESLAVLASAKQTEKTARSVDVHA